MTISTIAGWRRAQFCAAIDEGRRGLTGFICSGKVAEPLTGC
jgi:hypothetical protein